MTLDVKWTECDSYNLLILDGLLRLLQYSLHLLNWHDLMRKKNVAEKKLLQSNAHNRPVNNFLYIHNIIDLMLTSTPIWLVLLTETSITKRPTEMNQWTVQFSVKCAHKAVKMENMLFLYKLELCEQNCFWCSYNTWYCKLILTSTVTWINTQSPAQKFVVSFFFFLERN